MNDFPESADLLISNICSAVSSEGFNLQLSNSSSDNS